MSQMAGHQGKLFGNYSILGVLLNSQADMRLERSIWSVHFPVQKGK